MILKTTLSNRNATIQYMKEQQYLSVNSAFSIETYEA